MFTELQTILRHIGNTLYDVLVMPGDYLLAKIAEFAPALAERLEFVGDDRSMLLLVATSLLAWLFMALVVRKILRLVQDFVRYIIASIRTIFHRFSLALKNLKTRLVCILRLWIPRRANKLGAIPQVDFDDLDLAILGSAAARSPGFSVSVQELASHFTLRPAQIQRSLDKLYQNKMLDYIVGAKGRSDNYRLSQLGIAFTASWQ